MPIIAAGQSRQRQLVSTAWPPFTGAPGQPRFALDLVGVALERAGISAETVIVDDARLIASVLSGEFDGSAALLLRRPDPRGWSSLPERYKAPDSSRSERRRSLLGIFKFTW